MLTLTTLSVSFLLFAAAPPPAADGLAEEQFAPLRQLVRPHSGESRWRDVAWLTSLQEAREKAAAEGKPILLWSGGGAPPLGGC